MLHAVGRLLQTISPAEVKATANRLYLGRLGQDEQATYWRVFVARHRVLADLFEAQRSAFALLTRAYRERSKGAAVRERENWTWAKQAEFDPSIDVEMVWVNPRLPQPDQRALHPLRLQVSVLEGFREAFGQLEQTFGDSVLAAVLRLDDTCRFLIYTSVNEAEAYERCRGVRDKLKLTSIALSAELEPSWASLSALLQAREPEASSGKSTTTRTRRRGSA